MYDDNVDDGYDDYDDDYYAWSEEMPLYPDDPGYWS